MYILRASSPPRRLKPLPLPEAKAAKVPIAGPFRDAGGIFVHAQGALRFAGRAPYLFIFPFYLAFLPEKSLPFPNFTGIIRQIGDLCGGRKGESRENLLVFPVLLPLGGGGQVCMAKARPAFWTFQVFGRISL